jgi:hypothetical protein
VNYKKLAKEESQCETLCASMRSTNVGTQQQPVTPRFYVGFATRTPRLKRGGTAAYGRTTDAQFTSSGSSDRSRISRPPHRARRGAPPNPRACGIWWVRSPPAFSDTACAIGIEQNCLQTVGEVRSQFPDDSAHPSDRALVYRRNEDECAFLQSFDTMSDATVQAPCVRSDLPCNRSNLRRNPYLTVSRE